MKRALPGPEHINEPARAADPRDVAIDVEVCGPLVYERLLPAVPSSIARMRGELADALGRHDLAAGRRDDILLVMTEAATNAVWHAYRDSDPGPLYVSARLVDRSLIVAVADRGRWLLPRADGPGLGLGLSLMSRLSDDVLISHDAGAVGTCVRATFEGATAVTGGRTVMPAPGDRGEILREYLQLLTATHASLQQDTRAVLAEAERAVAHARRQQRERARRR